MVYIVFIFGIISVLIGIFRFNFFRKCQCYLLLIIGILCFLTLSIIVHVYLITIIMSMLLVVFIYILLKSIKTKPVIILEETTEDNQILIEILEKYKKEIYNYFPFYKKESSDRMFLIIKDLNVIGVLIVEIISTQLTIKIDYTKPACNHFEIVDYIYNKNTGYFKKMGIKKLLARSYHKKRDLYLKKLGFEQIYLEAKPIFIKSLD